MRSSAEFFQHATPHYVFYDLETSGLSPVFDQILQFAAIVTDKNFNPIKEYNIRVQLRSDVIPNPEALLVTRVTPEQLSLGETEFTAIRKIFEIINTPGTISVGYNSLKFDDQFLRFAFFRNFFPPYKHQFDNNCHRMDILPIVLMAYHFYPNTLRWPVVNGKVSFKLENLVRENNIHSGDSHDALIDAKDTIALTKLLSQNSTLWERSMAFFDKKKDEEKIASAQDVCIINNNRYTLGFMMDAHPAFPIMAVITLGKHGEYNNQTRWLRLDKMLFRTSALQEVLSVSMTVIKRYSEPPFFFNCDDVACRATFNDEAQRLIDDNISWIKENPTQFANIVSHHLGNSHSNHARVDAYSRLYQLGFPDSDMASLHEKFLLIEDDRKVEVAYRFPNGTYQELAIRFMGNNLSMPFIENQHDTSETKQQKKDAKERYDRYIKSVYSDEIAFDYRGEKRRTMTQALVEAQASQCDAREKKDNHSENFLSVLIKWYQEKIIQYDLRRRAREMRDESETARCLS